MIAVSFDDLPKPKEDAFRQWLTKPERDTLLEIARAKAKMLLAKVTTQAIEAKDHPAKLDAASTELKQAQEWAVFIEKFEEIYKNPVNKPFFTVRLS